MSSSRPGADIIILGINYHPEATGIAPYTKAMAEALVSGGLAVRVVTGVPHYPAWRVMDPKYCVGKRWEESVDGVPVTRVAHHVPAVPNLAGRARMEASFFSASWRTAAKLRSRAIIAVSPSLSGAAAALCAAGDRPVGVVVQDLTGAAISQSGTSGDLVGRAVAKAESRLLGKASVVGVITPRFAAALAQGGVDSGSIMDVANFTHISRAGHLDPASARSQLGWHYDGVVVMHTGNMGMKQGLDGVVRAARLAEEQRRDVTFVLLGDGNQRRAIEAMARGCRRLHIVAPLSEDDYPKALAAADMLLIHERPGVIDMSLPSKLTSYVAASRPIVAAVEPGGITRSVLEEHDAAAFAAPGDPQDLLDQVARLAQDPARRAALVGNAEHLERERYSPSAGTARYLQFAERLLRSG